MEKQDLSFILEQSDMDTLIITGWGWMDYACAAALALRHFGRAEVVGMSTRRLPEFLSEVKGFKEIVILGVGLIGNPKMLQGALDRLAKKNVHVCWISALDLPEEVFPDGCRNLEVFVKDAYLTECVGSYYDLPCDDLLAILDEKTRNPDAVHYHQLIEAAMFSVSFVVFHKLTFGIRPAAFRITVGEVANGIAVGAFVLVVAVGEHSCLNELVITHGIRIPRFLVKNR